MAAHSGQRLYTRITEHPPTPPHSVVKQLWSFKKWFSQEEKRKKKRARTNKKKGESANTVLIAVSKSSVK